MQLCLIQRWIKPRPCQYKNLVGYWWPHQFIGFCKPNSRRVCNKRSLLISCNVVLYCIGIIPHAKGVSIGNCRTRMKIQTNPARARRASAGLVWIFIRVQQFPMLTSLACGIIIPIQFISSLTYVRHQLHNLIGDLQLKLCKFKKIGK